MYIIKFRDIDEFIEELEISAGKGELDYPIVRFTQIDRPAGLDHMTHLVVIATAIARSTLLRFESACGSNWGFQTAQETQERANGISAELEEYCKKFGLEFRGGMFESP